METTRLRLGRAGAGERIARFRFKPSRPGPAEAGRGARTVPGPRERTDARGAAPRGERELIEPAVATRRAEARAVTVGRWDLRRARRT